MILLSKKIKNNVNLLEKNFFLSIILIVVIFSLDRIVKIKIIKEYEGQTHFINDFINLDLIWNTGIGFGLLSTNSLTIYNLTSFVIGLVIIVLLYFIIISKIINKLLFSLIAGGAIGNLYDRVLFNAVPDFIDIHFKGIHWFTFNVADVFITCGVILLLFRDLKKNE
jgi:signal peptidase II